MDDYEAVINIDPQQKTAYYNRALIKQNFNDYRGAIEDYSMAVSIDEQYGEAYYNRGVCKQQLNYAQDACLDWQYAIKNGYDKASEMMTTYCEE
ncbi:MAG: hypothetical protein IPL33_05870 [Sphingobacteriales bacterium]|nr:hypothetical protein [Sphingobacteriales bacterium]